MIPFNLLDSRLLRQQHKQLVTDSVIKKDKVTQLIHQEMLEILKEKGVLRPDFGIYTKTLLK
jgi:hypothetical protein